MSIDFGSFSVFCFPFYQIKRCGNLENLQRGPDLLPLSLLTCAMFSLISLLDDFMRQLLILFTINHPPTRARKKVFLLYGCMWITRSL